MISMASSASKFEASFTPAGLIPNARKKIASKNFIILGACAITESLAEATGDANYLSNGISNPVLKHDRRRTLPSNRVPNTCLLG
jgi:hypothetical protein